jgi:inner membrane protein
LTGKTHAAAGAFIGAVIGQLTGSPLEGFFLGMFAGLLPDIDHPRSTLGRKRKSLSFAVNAIAGHRGITHTVLQAGVSWPTPLVLGLIIFLGSLSHLLLDGITISGIEPFYPVRLPARLAWLEYPKGIIKTPGVGPPFLSAWDL